MGLNDIRKGQGLNLPEGKNSTRAVKLGPGRDRASIILASDLFQSLCTQQLWMVDVGAPREESRFFEGQKVIHGRVFERTRLGSSSSCSGGK